MRLSVRVRYAQPAALEPLLLAAEDLGYDGFWISEPWGLDAFAVLGWCAARTRRIALGTHVASVFARTPAATAAAAATVQSLSGGRFRLGLGTSGPAVVEGWHGVPFAQPVERTRDTVAVLRAVLSGDKVAHAGATVSIPVGEHRPLRTALPDDVAPVPVYLGALGPRNQRLTADVADGWTPTPYSPDFDAPLGAALYGRLAANGRALAVAPTCPVAVGGDLDALWDLERRWSALYLGGLGEFYAAVARAMGHGAMVDAVRERWAAGERRAAKAAVHVEYADAVGLFGSIDRIRERAARYAAAGVDELVLELRKPDLPDQLDDLRAVRGGVVVTETLSPDEFTELTYAVAEGVASVTLNRPDRRNAWSGRMAVEYRWALHHADNDPVVRVVVLAGAGRDFCVGADSGALDQINAANGAYAPEKLPLPPYPGGAPEEMRRNHLVPLLISTPVVAALHGACAGAGFVLATYADFRFAAEDARITTSFAKLGLPAEYGIGWLLPRQIGLASAAQLLYTAEVCDGARAHELGWVQQVHAADDLLPATLDFARGLARHSSGQSLRTMKRALTVDAWGSFDTAYTRSVEDMNAALRHPDLREGLAALRGKRAPEFLRGP